MFSSRLPPRMISNAFDAAVTRARRAGRALVDLTDTNPTRVGLPYPAAIAAALGDPAALVYAPDPLGTLAARAAVAAEYARRGLVVSPAQMLLTASTSEAYAMLFKLCCDPGDAVLIPQPSYPLFELLAGLEGIDARPYRLDPHASWAIDRDSLARACDASVRAVLVVSPNNPTGSILTADDRAWLFEFAASRDLAVIVDEVFAEYPLRPRATAVPALGGGEPPALVCSLGGLSKSIGLPQMKLAWTIVTGPAMRVDEALTRLELIADTFLSVSTPVQVALPSLLEEGAAVRAAIHARVRDNLARLEAEVARWPAITVLPPEGGWSAVLRVPATDGEERLCLRLIEDAGVIVHPGYFYDFAHEAYLVVSLLPDPDSFARATAALLPLAAGAAA